MLLKILQGPVQIDSFGRESIRRLQDGRKVSLAQSSSQFGNLLRRGQTVNLEHVGLRDLHSAKGDHLV